MLSKIFRLFREQPGLINKVAVTPANVTDAKGFAHVLPTSRAVYSECLINLVEMASGAAEAFKGSTTEGKRKLLNFVFSNLELKGGKLDFKLRPPFDMFVKCTKIEEWCTRLDSNQRPLPSEGNALSS